MQCPCCDHYSLDDIYDICPVCFWEYDGFDIDKPDVRSPCNRLTIREARANFRRLGACEADMLPNVLPPEERHSFRFLPRELG